MYIGALILSCGSVFARKFENYLLRMGPIWVAYKGGYVGIL